MSVELVCATAMWVVFLIMCYRRPDTVEFLYQPLENPVAAAGTGVLILAGFGVIFTFLGWVGTYLTIAGRFLLLPLTALWQLLF